MSSSCALNLSCSETLWNPDSPACPASGRKEAFTESVPVGLAFSRHVKERLTGGVCLVLLQNKFS